MSRLTLPRANLDVSQESMTEFIARLKQHKLVQWAVAYLAAAWVLLQAIDLAVDSYDWPHGVMRIAFGLIALGFVVALVLAWYHGEKGRQRVSSAELLLIALVLAIGGGLLWRFGRPASIPATAAVAAASHIATSSPDAAQRNPGTAIPDSFAGAISSGVRSATPASTTHGSPQTIPIPAKSVAVLPFVNMSGDAKNDYFSDGITEEVLDALAQIPHLKVAARTSAFAFKGKAEDLRKVGEVLDVATVLEGSVQKSGDEVRITAQLIDTRTGYHLWSEKYDRKLTSIFAVEDEISKAIADKLQVQLTDSDNQSLVPQQAIDPRAHDFYLRGLALLAARGPALRDAVAAFQNAVKIAPDYAPAWGAMAEAEALYPAYQLDSMQAASTRALASAKQALALDPDLASAYVTQGMILVSRWQWPQADRAFQRALTLAPSDAFVLNQYAQFLLTTGQLESALTASDRAQAVDPLNKVNGVTRAYALYALHRYQEAWAQVQRTLVLYPDYLPARGDAVDIAVALKNNLEIDRQARLLAPLVGVNPDDLAQRTLARANPSLRAAVVQRLKTSSVGAASRHVPQVVMAGGLAQLGERDEALDLLEGAVDHPDGMDISGIWTPTFDSIRDDPRFKSLLKQMGLPYTPAKGTAP
jgi:adenylate cyclase